ncbi:hypothetical protein BOTBODRAFT_401056 [Botryobasidium botryosum FD-172 SS1]|uniref:Uncharacterized protein n=1 Tax=Botryobasidium botryosum (strain FD-172 SS1) TaxID=930990 RepID=A0A067MBT5_BOTB1|nr:hypothetical protein BOTBODRAFT_401056 [Botryobasidium botryosum FD-172 SS1]
MFYCSISVWHTPSNLTFVWAILLAFGMYYIASGAFLFIFLLLISIAHHRYVRDLIVYSRYFWLLLACAPSCPPSSLQSRICMPETAAVVGAIPDHPASCGL